MDVSNIFEEKSLRWTQERPHFLERRDELYDFLEIYDYCKEINEQIRFSEDVYYEEIEDGVIFCEWLYDAGTSEGEEERRFFQEILSKSCSSVQNDREEEGKQAILVSLGVYPGCVATRKEYVEARRKILSEIQNVREYEAFMHSCFINSVFADNILQEMKNIKDFSLRAEEITKNLAVLNDEAIELYKLYSNDLKKAMQILTAKLLECSDDPKHRRYLIFPFTYSELARGDNSAKTKKILCEPHLKLIRQDSDLRIYFSWSDPEVGEGEKVLIGRIGRHPY